ncbi:Ankyrin repeat domain-containing protein [Plasmodiophora brassicae]|uniref:Uncharacterized protein n=1 Tax=Plasmodiophora brassicae TaxID=37360 RepID=A0A3P3Y6E9_PLABS|nr:unnamed protein product [Plasmodiophora brassicae]
MRAWRTITYPPVLCALAVILQVSAANDSVDAQALDPAAATLSRQHPLPVLPLEIQNEIFHMLFSNMKILEMLTFLRDASGWSRQLYYPAVVTFLEKFDSGTFDEFANSTDILLDRQRVEIATLAQACRKSVPTPAMVQNDEIALRRAVETCQLDIIPFYISQVNCPDALKLTALHHLLEAKCDERRRLFVLRLLLDHGADQRHPDGHGDIVLHKAVRQEMLTVVEKLLSRDPLVVNERGIGGNTPLHIAYQMLRSRNGRSPAMIELLSSYNASLDIVNDEGKTPQSMQNPHVWLTDYVLNLFERLNSNLCALPRSVQANVDTCKSIIIKYGPSPSSLKFLLMSFTVAVRLLMDHLNYCLLHTSVLT